MTAAPRSAAARSLRDSRSRSASLNRRPIVGLSASASGSRPMGRAPPIVGASGLCRRYRLGDKFVDAVQDASLVIEQGEFVAIRGRSGSGKSTLLGLLGLLEQPDSGHYAFLGREVADLSEDARAL